MTRHNSDNSLPVIGVTMGEPAGIGPELVVKALADPELRSRAKFVIFGMHDLLETASDMAEIPPFWHRLQHEFHHEVPDDEVVLMDYDEFFMPFVLHEPSRKGGIASMRFLEDAIALAKKGNLDAIVTAPIAKASWQAAGFPFPGHTELLAKNFREKRYAMMFIAGPLRIILATIHVGFSEVPGRLKIGKIFDAIDLAQETLTEWFGMDKPIIAVAGLNPHAGEGGMFGEEEERIIEPAIVMAQNAGINAVGPLPADTLFYRTLKGEFDAVVAMYHDQALIPIKLVAFDTAVNMTVGLPIIRTSPSGGTAFDIAGRNRADAASMKAAIRIASQLARQVRRKNALAAETPPES
jgi:4-hydroxythreonine-4-phosphate dehydrogenase